MQHGPPAVKHNTVLSAGFGGSVLHTTSTKAATHPEQNMKILQEKSGRDLPTASVLSGLRRPPPLGREPLELGAAAHDLRMGLSRLERWIRPGTSSRSEGRGSWWLCRTPWPKRLYKDVQPGCK